MPGIMAYQIYGNVLERPEAAYPHLMKTILPVGFKGLMFAALAGSIMGAATAGLNSAATIFTIDFYSKFVNKSLTPRGEAKVGRISTVVLVIIACLWAPVINFFPGVFPYIQEIWGFISPGIVAAFLGGVAFKYAPVAAGKGALILGPILYGCIRVPGWILKAMYLVPGTKDVVKPPEGFLTHVWEFCGKTSFLHHMAIVFLIIFFGMWVVAKLRPMPKPVIMPKSEVDVTPDPKVYVLGVLVIAATVALYIIWR